MTEAPLTEREEKFFGFLVEAKGIMKMMETHIAQLEEENKTLREYVNRVVPMVGELLEAQTAKGTGTKEGI